MIPLRVRNRVSLVIEPSGLQIGVAIAGDFGHFVAAREGEVDACPIYSTNEVLTSCLLMPIRAASEFSRSFLPASRSSDAFRQQGLRTTGS